MILPKHLTETTGKLVDIILVVRGWFIIEIIPITAGQIMDVVGLYCIPKQTSDIQQHMKLHRYLQYKMVNIFTLSATVCMYV